MGGSSFPRSPLNAKHLPGKHNRHGEREREEGDDGRQNMVLFLAPVKKVIDLISLKSHSIDLLLCLLFIQNFQTTKTYIMQSIKVLPMQACSRFAHSGQQLFCPL